MSLNSDLAVFYCVRVCERACVHQLFSSQANICCTVIAVWRCIMSLCVSVCVRERQKEIEKMAWRMQCGWNWISFILHTEDNVSICVKCCVVCKAIANVYIPLQIFFLYCLEDWNENLVNHIHFHFLLTSKSKGKQYSLPSFRVWKKNLKTPVWVILHVCAFCFENAQPGKSERIIEATDG